MKYLLSIIIPTKNRYKYLRYCIKALTQLDSSLTEIIIQDNSDNNEEIIEFLELNQFENVKYFYSGSTSISQTENSELALEKATGEYVCFVGDDDSVTPWLLDVVDWMKNNNSEGVIFAPASYSWPDLKYRVFKFPSLIIPRIESKFITLNPKHELHKCLREGGQLLNLPKTYHGVISKDTLDKVKTKFGKYFPGASPDMANAVALSTVINQYHILRLPIIISGTSYYSAGGMGARGQHKAQIETVTQLPKGISNEWIPEIPKIWTGESIWAHSCLEVLKRLDSNELRRKFNYSKLYARMIVMNTDCWDFVKPCMKNKKNYFMTLIYILQLFFKRAIKFMSNFLKVKFRISSATIIDDVCNVKDATIIVNEFITNLNLKIFRNSEVQ